MEAKPNVCKLTLTSKYHGILTAIGAVLLFGYAPVAANSQATNLGNQQRGIQVEEPAPSARTGHRFVVAIGIDTYANWPRLNTAVNDATGFAGLLRTRFNYEDAFPPLTDKQATRENIESLIDDDLRGKLKPDDDLVIFFAGHGTTRNRSCRRCPDQDRLPRPV